MARQDYGNPLTAPVLQAGGKLSNDGYGLLTATCVWKANTDNDLSVGNRGSTCPIGPSGALSAHKFGVTYDALGVATITVDYIGIDPTINGGVYTNPQVSAANGLTSENITANPNFFDDGGDGYDGVIAGRTYTASPLGPLVEIKNTADWVSVFLYNNSDGTPQYGKVGKKQSYIGENGACFESENGGRFIGFVDSNYKHLYGKTNYLAPQSSFSGHFYTTEASEVQNMVSYLGTTSRDNDWSSVLPPIIPAYAGTSWVSSTANGSFNQLLLSQVNVEDYGLLFKVNYEVRFSLVGWSDKVYRDNRLI